MAQAEMQRRKEEKDTAVGAAGTPANTRLVGCWYAVSADTASEGMYAPLEAVNA